MKRFPLGKTGLMVSQLGIGLAEAGLNMTMADTKEVSAILNDALDRGVNLIDAAARYGYSEEMIGATIAHRRTEYIIATKVESPYTLESITREIDDSLRKMRTDYIDIIQLHTCTAGVMMRPVTMEALYKAKKAGKVRFLGYSGDNENAHWAIESGLFETLQTSFNLVDQSARYLLLPRAEEKGLGIIVKRAIGNAVWGAKRDPDPFAPEIAADYTKEYFERARRLEGMGPLADDPQDRILLAIGFVLGHPEVDVAIVGTTSHRHFIRNVERVESKLPISEKTMDDLHNRFDEIAGFWAQLG
jgi:aryl-alcohol dehydrogenase-like predicted oxidoreductase